jgi:hypothetical protein
VEFDLSSSSSDDEDETKTQPSRKVSADSSPDEDVVEVG